MTIRINHLIAVLEIILFTVSVGVLSYYGQLQKWVSFWILLVICTIIFFALQIAKSKPVLDQLKKLESKEFWLAYKFDASGIQDFYNMQDPKEQFNRNEITREIIQQGHVFSLLGLTAASYIDPGIHRHWDFLKAKLDDGVPFRLLLVDPYSEEKKVRDKLNNIFTVPDPKFRLDLVSNLTQRYPNVSVRFTPFNPYCSVFFSEEEMIYDPYHLGKVEDRIENHFLAFRLKKQVTKPKFSPFNILKQHFEFLWLTSTDLDTFIKLHPIDLNKSRRDIS